MRRSDYGKAHTTGRAAAGSRQVAIRLSAEEYARVCAASGERSVTGWCTDAVLDAEDAARMDACAAATAGIRVEAGYEEAIGKPATTVVG